MALWFLPDNVADMLPAEALRAESARRTLVDLFRRCGFELIDPPLVEYVESLLTGSGSDLDLKTFKLVDQASGRMLGVRADFTPQAARIDAHILNRPGVTRLCYSGNSLHAQARHPMASRQPIVAGAEIFGATGREADSEMIKLAVRSLREIGIGHVLIDLGHSGLLRAVLEPDPASRDCLGGVIRALVAKDATGIETAGAALRAETRKTLRLLADVWGGAEALGELRRALPADRSVQDAIDDVEWLGAHSGADEVVYDFSDIHGYEYLTGVTLSAYVAGVSQAVLRGGRYDGIGSAFGRLRPATGFTVYLRDALEGLPAAGLPKAVLAPASGERGLLDLVESLRDAGEIVVHPLPGEDPAGLSDSFDFDREIVLMNGQWVVRGRTVR